MPQYGADVAAVRYQTWENGKQKISKSQVMSLDLHAREAKRMVQIDYGADGLKRLDKVVKLAEKKGLKLVVALTNNWADYGGMDVYTVNLGGKYHDDVRSNIAFVLSVSH